MSTTKVTSEVLDLTDAYAFTGTVTGAGGVATGFIGGLTITNNGSDGDHDIDIAVGSARDYADAVTMTQGTAALTKRIDATWAVGDGNGGLDSTDTVANNTGYGVYLIRRSDTGVVDVLISSDMTAAGSALTLPTNYDQKRLIGWVRTDGSANILAFIQSGDYFRITGDIVAEITDATMSNNSFEDGTLTTPPLCFAQVYLHIDNQTETNTAHNFSVKTKGAADDATAKQNQLNVNTSNAVGRTLCMDASILTDSASQIEYACLESAGTATMTISLIGCNMFTRSNP